MAINQQLRNSRPLVRTLLRWAATLALLYAGVLTLLMLLEENLIFFPVKYPSGFWEAEERTTAQGRLLPKIESAFFTASDGVRLHGWYCTPPGSAESEEAGTQSGRMVLIWFHGNAGNITYRYGMIQRLLQLPIEIFIIDYRGYGRSEGSPSEAGLYLDAKAAWDYLVSERGIAPSRIILFGKSLGSAPAVELATRVEPAGLIVQSGFTSVPDMAASVFPFVPRFLIRTRMDSLSRIGGITCRKLFIHSPADEVVPYRLGRRLYEAAAEPKSFYEVAGSPHNETYLVGGDAYLEALGSFIRSCAEN